MSTLFSQLSRWPPTATTVIGLGVLLGLVSYLVFGDLRVAVAVAGAFKILCPQDAGAVDQALVIDDKIIPHEGKVT